MPKLIIVAGPNGAGKTSFAKQYLPRLRQGFVYVNADEIGRALRVDGRDQRSVDVAASRRMLADVDEAISDRRNLMIETTLASRTYARRIQMWHSFGYQSALVYLKLASAEQSLERVRRRVSAGGHDIPENVIRRRFDKSLLYLETVYKPLVQEWYVWKSLEGSFEPLEAWDTR